MKMKVIIKICVYLILALPGRSLLAQPVALAPNEQKQTDLAFSFLARVKAMDSSNVNEKELLDKYLSEKYGEPARQQYFRSMLKTLQTQLQDMNLDKYTAVPWFKYSYPDKLPRLVDETEPITHVMGEPIAVPAKPSASEKARLREAIVVGFEREHPGQPAFFILFTPEKDRILSWVLLKQGDYHYFLLP